MPQPPSRPNTPVTYRDAGVDIDAGHRLVETIKPMAKATRRPGAEADLGGFGGVFDLQAAGFKDPILVAANDGVGTKLKIAIATGKHDTIGIDLVAMCVNDLIVQGAEPLFFLDYFSCGQLDTAVAGAVISGVAAGCQQAGCALIGGETAEMAGMYEDGDYDLAGFAVGAAERGQLLPRDGIEAGDLVIGLAASGVHSNGYSLVRRLIDDSGLAWDSAAPFDRQTSLAQALLTPTRIYVKPLLAAMRGSPGLRALAHITGGGLTDNIPRVLPAHLAVMIDLAAWSPAPVFGWLQQTARIDDHEMLRTFNCGIGMIVIAQPAAHDDILQLLAEQGETGIVIGRVEERGGAAPVRFSGRLT